MKRIQNLKHVDALSSRTLRAAVTGVTLLTVGPVLSGCRAIEPALTAMYSENEQDIDASIADLRKIKHLISGKMALIDVGAKANTLYARRAAIRVLSSYENELLGVSTSIRPQNDGGQDPLQEQTVQAVADELAKMPTKLKKPKSFQTIACFAGNQADRTSAFEKIRKDSCLLSALTDCPDSEVSKKAEKLLESNPCEDLD